MMPGDGWAPALSGAQKPRPSLGRSSGRSAGRRWRRCPVRAARAGRNCWRRVLCATGCIPTANTASTSNHGHVCPEATVTSNSTAARSSRAPLAANAVQLGAGPGMKACARRAVDGSSADPCATRRRPAAPASARRRYDPRHTPPIAGGPISPSAGGGSDHEGLGGIHCHDQSDRAHGAGQAAQAGPAVIGPRWAVLRSVGPALTAAALDHLQASAGVC